MVKDNTKSKMRTEELKKERVNLIRSQLGLLFQRFNYFLIGISFLLISFATIVSSVRFYPNTDNIYFILLAGLICAAGCSLSFFFAIVNHTSSIIMEKLGRNVGSPAYDDSVASIAQWESEPWEKIGESFWPWALFSDIWDVVEHPFGEEGKGKAAPHTYLVPFGFTILWFSIWAILCFSIFYTLLLPFLHLVLTLVILVTIILPLPLALVFFYLCKVKKIRQKPQDEEPTNNSGQGLLK